MRRTEDIWDDDNGGGNDVGGQYQAHWAINCQWCPILWNINGGLSPSLSLAREWGTNKAPPTRRIGCGIGGENGVPSGRTHTGSRS